MEHLLDLKFISGLVLGIIPWAWKKFELIRNKTAIYKWMKEHSEDIDGKRFFKTSSICNGVNLTNSEVTLSCY